MLSDQSGVQIDDQRVMDGGPVIGGAGSGECPDPASYRRALAITNPINGEWLR